MDNTNYKQFLKMADDFISLIPYADVKCSATKCPAMKCPAMKCSTMKCPAMKCPMQNFPQYNLEVSQTVYIYTFDVPGVKKEDLTIKEENGSLTIEGKREKNITAEGS